MTRKSRAVLAISGSSASKSCLPIDYLLSQGVETLGLLLLYVDGLPEILFPEIGALEAVAPMVAWNYFGHRL